MFPVSDFVLTSSPSFSLSCHSEKSRVNFSSAGNPRPLLPPHGHRSSLSLKRVVDQSLQMWSRFGSPCCPLTPMVECHLYSAFKFKITHRIIVNLPIGASLKLKALILLANVSNNMQTEYLDPRKLLLAYLTDIQRDSYSEMNELHLRRQIQNYCVRRGLVAPLSRPYDL